MSKLILFKLPKKTMDILKVSRHELEDIKQTFERFDHHLDQSLDRLEALTSKKMAGDQRSHESNI